MLPQNVKSAVEIFTGNAPLHRKGEWLKRQKTPKRFSVVFTNWKTVTHWNYLHCTVVVVSARQTSFNFLGQLFFFHYFHAPCSAQFICTHWFLFNCTGGFFTFLCIISNTLQYLILASKLQAQIIKIRENLPYIAPSHSTLDSYFPTPFRFFTS